MTTSPLTLTEAQQRELHHAAAVQVAAAIARRPPSVRDATLGGAANQRVYGVFVSLKRQGRLRGCCGVFGDTTIGDALARASARTANDDVRLPAVSASELPYLDLEVWVLHDQKPVTARGEDRRGSVEIGRHGLWVRRGPSSGLLLPGVAVEAGVDADGFLQMVCQKAGLPPTAWKEDDVQLGTFEGVVASGAFDGEVAGAAPVAPTLSAEGLGRLVRHCQENVVALRRGAVASHYLAGGPEGMVHGLSIAVQLADDPTPMRFSKLSLRPGLALQATLFGLLETADRTLASRRVDVSAVAGHHVELTVLSDPAMHGTVATPDFGGFDPSKRALLVLEGTRSAWVYDPTASTDALLARAAREAKVKLPANAAVLSLAVASTAPRVTVADVPRPESGQKVRPPAVAGTFYPGNEADLRQMVKKLTPLAPPALTSVPAVMVPHAGLKFSGHLAAAVYARIAVPDLVLILAPRHYRQGADWAIAPHETWALPGMSVASDPSFARELADAIPDLELDAVAHQREHSIEVQLPLLAQIAPRARVVGIALGAGDVARCQELAAGLAAVLRARRERPLIVISTDLNHYATDAENRRLDAIALAAVETLDPAGVYGTVTEHRISMCGLLPTVVGMETLRRLGLLRTVERVGYATSADATGDTSRVVGYAGMLFS
jgi:AmmeMemoRadiSam system protein B/AmmeMemoRadiSam system protein A